MDCEVYVEGCLMHLAPLTCQPQVAARAFPFDFKTPRFFTDPARPFIRFLAANRQVNGCTDQERANICMLTAESGREAESSGFVCSEQR